MGAHTVVPKSLTCAVTTATCQRLRLIFQHYPHKVQLLQSLMDWRDLCAKECIPTAVFINLGPDIFIPLLIIKHIVDCVHYKKINSFEDLQRESKYFDIMAYDGQHILHLINLSHPPPPPPQTSPFVTTPLQAFATYPTTLTPS